MDLSSALDSDEREHRESSGARFRARLRAFIDKHAMLRVPVWNLKGTGLARVVISAPGSSVDTVRILTLPGVYRPSDDSALLAEALSAANLKPGADVLDLCAGSGVLSIAAARLGAGTITAVDISRLAMTCIRLNALLHRAPVHAGRGDLSAVLGEATFDAIVCNPPWRPSPTDELPTRGIARAWDAGKDARALIDRVCTGAATRLRAGGFMLIVQASFCDVEATVRLLAAQGLGVRVVARRTAPMAQLDEQARALQQGGPWAASDQTYELVVIRASKALSA
jgi:release factor glutamine methyltransferase